MNRTVCLGLGLLAACLPAGPVQAFQVSAVSFAQGDEVCPPISLTDLEQAVQSLEQECSAPPGSPDVAPPPVAAAPAAPPTVVSSRQPISIQCRVITTTVHFSRLRVDDDNGPDMWYTQGFFVDPTDNKTCHFLFNDMGAAAAANDEKAQCIVVYRPCDRQLTESDIQAIIPIEWVKDQAAPK